MKPVPCMGLDLFLSGAGIFLEKRWIHPTLRKRGEGWGTRSCREPMSQKRDMGHPVSPYFYIFVWIVCLRQRCAGGTVIIVEATWSEMECTI